MDENIQSGMTSPRILHIAPENTAGVPFNLMNMQRKHGYHSRLITFYKIPFSFSEDICLDLPLPRSKFAMKWRKLKQSRLQKRVMQGGQDLYSHLPYHSHKNILEKLYWLSREK
jgi:hypothetical protein